MIYFSVDHPPAVGEDKELLTDLVLPTQIVESTARVW